MKDFLFISHNFGQTQVKRIEKFLRDNDLDKFSSLSTSGITSGLCHIRLPIQDTRISDFIGEIEREGVKPLIRYDREFESNELDEADYLVLTIATVGLGNPSEKQVLDIQKKCSICGSGIRPLPPMILPANKMGKKQLDHTSHNNWLIFTRQLGSMLTDRKISGIVFHQAILGRENESYKWGEITNELPKLHSDSRYNQNHSKCPNCGLSGNFRNFDSPTSFAYPIESKLGFKDINISVEHFGEWTFSKKGGSRLIIISQPLRQLLIEQKVKNLVFEPLNFK